MQRKEGFVFSQAQIFAYPNMRSEICEIVDRYRQQQLAVDSNKTKRAIQPFLCVAVADISRFCFPQKFIAFHSRNVIIKF